MSLPLTAGVIGGVRADLSELRSGLDVDVPVARRRPAFARLPAPRRVLVLLVALVALHALERAQRADRLDVPRPGAEDPADGLDHARRDATASSASSSPPSRVSRRRRACSSSASASWRQTVTATNQARR